MSSKALLYTGIFFVIIIIIALAAYLMSGSSLSFLGGTSSVAVQITGTPNTPPGTQHLFVKYSSVEVHTVADTSVNGSKTVWIPATGSGTIDLANITNVAKTMATVAVTSNSTVNLVRFNIDAAQIVIGNVTYNVTVPNSQINAAVIGRQKLNENSSAVVVDLFPKVTANAGANYTMTSAAKAILINSNATVNINMGINGTSNLTSEISSRLGINVR